MQTPYDKKPVVIHTVMTMKNVDGKARLCGLEDKDTLDSPEVLAEFEASILELFSPSGKGRRLN